MNIVQLFPFHDLNGVPIPCIGPPHTPLPILGLTVSLHNRQSFSNTRDLIK